MQDKSDTNLIERVARLESLVERLSVQIERLSVSSQSNLVTPVSQPRQTPLPPPPVIERQPTSRVAPQQPTFVPDNRQSTAGTTPPFTFPEHMRKSEYWLNKIGIGLLLFGAVFLFKYSVDQGWLSPTIRVFFGLALGGTLSFLGFRLYEKKKHFSQVLLGGSIATFYITGYSAFQLFHLVTYPVAFSFFAITTLYSFYLSLKQNEFIFSLIAIIGGLGTPFLLYTGEGSVPGLMAYVSVLLAGASGIYFFKGWWSFFWTSCVGGITVIWIAMFGEKSFDYAPMMDKISIEIAIFLTLPFFWLVPLAREVAVSKYPNMVSAKPQIPPDTVARYQPNLPELNVNVLTVLIPFLSIFLSNAIWNWTDGVWGIVTMVLAVAFGIVGWFLNFKTELKNFAYTHFIVGLGLLAFSIQYFLDGDALIIALALQATAIHLVRLKIGGKSLAPAAHTLFGLVAMFLFFRIVENREGTVILNSQALSDLVVCACSLGLIRIFQKMDEKRIYLIGGFLGVVGITFRELNGNIEFLIVAVESGTLLYVSARMKDKGLLTASHLVGAVVAIWLLLRLFGSAEGTAIFNEKSLIDIIVIAIIAGVTLLIEDRDVKRPYFFAAHVALLAWFLRELSPLENGQGLVSVAWGIYTIGMFVVGLRKDLKAVTKTAMVTLLVLIGKLFLIDLANIETIWRVVIFLSFGAVLLFLSYYFQSLWRTKKG